MIIQLTNSEGMRERNRPSRGTYDELGRQPVHPFPARMAPSVALDAIANSGRPLRILDPMSGSGTVLAVAQCKGHQAIGFDLDPLAVLISKVWTSPIDVDVFLDAAAVVLERARSLFRSMPTRDAYPQDADAETRKFVRYWFDDYARRQLASLAVAIDSTLDLMIRNALWCAFSRLIITKQAGASLAMDLSHSRPHRKFTRAPAKPFRTFLAAVQRVAANCIDNGNNWSGPVAEVYEGDARNVGLPDGAIDLVITSPPYLNAIDYLRCSKFSLVWMGYSISGLRRLRSGTVGTEVGLDLRDHPGIQRCLSALELKPKLEARQEAILARYAYDMRRTVGEASRVLQKGGRAVYVVGENTLRGTFIPNARLVESVAGASGLLRIARRSRELPANRRYLPPPSKESDATSLGSRLRREVILTFQKVA